ncbi:hypothetical protein BO224_00830 [Erysipelotrichaceae bacterium NYU-BL-E8]|uniref:Uncharacterized protein n=1 Tax=Ileibacterium valens TaxID=1862668 RepID=A0A1U7NES0_9FIRM|nr:hypothetical protein BO222_08700 [Ileibacterium valens]OLU42504.1 hypothetical protein BM735_02200 [Erysipelotrichaceae bacterium NYU-BL-F16]OLU43054.1 hypothetical protein BO224_00830 [Erysipelotrichaceae bacterium NYU-BL-E8]
MPDSVTVRKAIRNVFNAFQKKKKPIRRDSLCSDRLALCMASCYFRCSLSSPLKGLASGFEKCLGISILPSRPHLGSFKTKHQRHPSCLLSLFFVFYTSLASIKPSTD